MNYAMPIWTSSLSDSRWEDLQVKQNAALRTVTGCHVMISVPHSHHETKLMTVREHKELLSIQFLLGAFREGLPYYRTTEQPLPGKGRLVPHSWWSLATGSCTTLTMRPWSTWMSQHTGRASHKSIETWWWRQPPPTPTNLANCMGWTLDQQGGGETAKENKVHGRPT